MHGFFYKTVLEIFKITLRLRYRHVFLWQPLEILNVFITLSLNLIFWKTKHFLKKLEYCFSVQSIKIESAIFQHKTALPEANAKTKKWEVQNGPITKAGVLPVATLFFWKFCFRVTDSSKELIRCINNPNVHIHTFRKRWSFIWRCFFSVSLTTA